MNGPTEHPSDVEKNPLQTQRPTIVNNSLNRSKAMLLMHENMARAQQKRRLEELYRHELSRRVVAAHRAQRRADRAERRAERHATRAARLLDLASVR